MPLDKKNAKFIIKDSNGALVELLDTNKLLKEVSGRSEGNSIGYITPTAVEDQPFSGSIESGIFSIFVEKHAEYYHPVLNRDSSGNTIADTNQYYSHLKFNSSTNSYDINLASPYYDSTSSVDSDPVKYISFIHGEQTVALTVGSDSYVLSFLNGTTENAIEYMTVSEVLAQCQNSDLGIELGVYTATQIRSSISLTNQITNLGYKIYFKLIKNSNYSYRVQFTYVLKPYIYLNNTYIDNTSKELFFPLEIGDTSKEILITDTEPTALSTAHLDNDSIIFVADGSSMSDNNLPVYTTTNQVIDGVKKFNSGIFGGVAALSGSTIDVSTAACFTKTITADTTFTITGAPANTCSVFTLVLTNGGSYSITWPSSVKWSYNIVPDLTDTGVDILTFLTPDGGTTWYGSVNTTGVTV